MTHDQQCENLAGGSYHGQTIGGGSDGFTVREPMPIPCHCAARAEGRAQAEREISRQAAPSAGLADHMRDHHEWRILDTEQGDTDTLRAMHRVALEQNPGERTEACTAHLPRVTRQSAYRGQPVWVVRDSEWTPAFVLAYGPNVVRWQGIAPNASTPGKWGEAHRHLVTVYAR